METLHLAPLHLLVEVEAFLSEDQPQAAMAVLAVGVDGVAPAGLVTLQVLHHRKEIMVAEAPDRAVLALLAAAVAQARLVKVGQIVPQQTAQVALEQPLASLAEA